MKIDIQKVHETLGSIRQQIQECRETLGTLVMKETALEEFLTMAMAYEIHEEGEVSEFLSLPADTGEAEPAPPVEAETDQIFKSTKRRLIVAQAVAGAFEAGAIITVHDVVAKIGTIAELIGRDLDAEVTSPAHQMSAILIHELRDDGILERIDIGKWRVRDDALGIVNRRLAAEEASRQ